LNLFKSLCVILFCLKFVFPNAIPDINSPLIQPTLGISASGISSALSKADIALCKSIIQPRHLMGDYGEALVGKFYLEQHLSKSGSWEGLSSNFGRQGIDQIYIKYDKLGRPRDIIVAEMKYGSSKLRMTKKHGLQLGKPWTNNHFLSSAKIYVNGAISTDIKHQTRLSKLSVLNQFEIRVNQSEKVIFWRENKNQGWKYEGKPEHLKMAQRKALLTGQFLTKAGEGVVRVRRRLFEIETIGQNLKITIKDAAKLDLKVPPANLKGRSITVPLSGDFGKLSNQILSENIAVQIKRKMPHFSDSDAYDYARKIVKKISSVERFRHSNLSRQNTILAYSLRAGLASAIITTAIEILTSNSKNSISYNHLLSLGVLNLGSTTIGSALGQQTTRKIIQSKIAHGAISRVASSLGLSTSVISQSIGAGVGAGVTTFLFAYGGYYLGYYSSYTANKIMVSNIVGISAASIANIGTNSILASSLWSAGSIAASSTVVTLVVYVVATAVVMYSFQYLEEKDQDKILSLMLNDYKSGSVFDMQAALIFPLKPTSTRF
jgi:hypothetical protein